MISRLLFLLALITISCSKHEKADLVITGKIWTGNPKQPFAEGLAVRGDSIVAVGAASDILKWEGENTVKMVANDGQLVVPGFIDTHTHFVDGGFRLSSVQLRDAKTPA